VQAIREEITAIDADQPTMHVRTMTEVVESQVATFSAMRGLLIIFGALALMLATIGIYGVMSYTVAQRVREIGIRVALGAQAGQVRWLMSKQGLQLTLAGLALGLAGSVVVTRALQALLVGVGGCRACHDGLGIGHLGRGCDLGHLRSRRPRHTRRPGDGLA